ncbi:MAG: hypothetical protein OEW36_14535 [Hylemonella sp.]|nr:hypothetical protein [Hylemonella sp.]
MNLRGQSLPLLLVCAGLGLSARAADYPASRIAHELAQARQAVQVDLTELKAGELKVVDYVGRPVWIYRRTKDDLAYLRAGQQEHLANPGREGYLRAIEDQYLGAVDEVWTRLLLLAQPNVEREKFRSLTADYLVVLGQGPLGCLLRPAPADRRPFPWAPFFDLCAGTWFDVAGRLLKSDWKEPQARARALRTANLLIPPHHFRTATTLVIGLRPEDSVPDLDVKGLRTRVYARLDPALRLVYAVKFNDIEEVRRLLASMAAMPQPMPRPNPLDAAIIGGSAKLIDLLLDHGFRPTKSTYEITTITDRPDVREHLRRRAP